MFSDIRRFPSIDSTNRYLLDEARAGAAEGVVAVAEFQTSGRGRMGRRWEAPPGANLLTSVLLRPDLRLEERHLATAVVALAARDAASSVAEVTLWVKWPNDLLAGDGRKVAGILAEADTGSGGVDEVDRAALVVGLGLNVNWPSDDADLPDDLARTACSLAQLAGRPFEVARVLDALLVSLEPRVHDLATREGRRRQATELERVCTTVGARVRVVLADEEFDGTATGLTGEGHLVVETTAGSRTVVAGDVVHLRGTGDGEGPGGASRHG